MSYSYEEISLIILTEIERRSHNHKNEDVTEKNFDSSWIHREHSSIAITVLNNTDKEEVVKEAICDIRTMQALEKIDRMTEFLTYIRHINHTIAAYYAIVAVSYSLTYKDVRPFLVK